MRRACSTRYEDAVWFGRRLEEQNYLWSEEPMDHL